MLKNQEREKKKKKKTNGDEREEVEDAEEGNKRRKNMEEEDQMATISPFFNWPWKQTAQGSPDLTPHLSKQCTWLIWTWL